jgi:hypothetical protein
MDFHDENEKLNGGWLKWATFVLRTLQSHEDKIQELQKHESDDRIQFTEFKTKVETRSSMLAVIISVLVTILVNILVLFVK